ncbi:HAD family hydrolase [Flavobacterium caeni]|uniref:HAD family hydrolase n=1 Tax=Flavobacterium caeni TaxID=490189 RepID=A0A1G5AXA4_9FLAO|nr:HAD family hydrolase [Flavobacterium caeni]SCX82503.1 hypothetical protein SAMN02927903_00184 [Flavobacterium caeni]
MIKLVVTDMDGSLLNDAKEIPTDFYEIFADLKRQSIQFVVASGRQMYTLQHDVFDVRESVYFISENGAFVAKGDQVLHLDALPREAVNELLEAGATVPDAYFILCGKNSAYVRDTDVRFLNEAKKFFKRLEIVEDFASIDDDILKVTMCDFRNAEFNSLRYFERFSDRFKVTIGAERYLDVTSLTANKGHALRGLQTQLGITPEETIVFGDYLNDLEMMQAATYSYAMKNAHPEILQTANFITEWDNNESGVTRTLRALGLAQKPSAAKSC